MRRQLLIAVLCACGPSVELEETGDTEGPSTTSSTTGPLPATSSPSTSPPTTTTVGTTLDDSSGDSSSDDGSFIDETTGVCLCECSVWDQDCPRGEKCTAWANDGGEWWNAVRCRPIADDPDAPGDPCSVQDSHASGLDSCALGSMCWDVDPDTNMGTCVALCTGTENDPQCPASTECVIANDGVIILCLPSCDPIVDECGIDHTCEPLGYGGAFACVPGMPGETPYGQPCEREYACEPGSTCVPSDQMPDIGACTPKIGGCCTAYCDLAAADPDAGCPDQALGQTCVSYYEPAQLGVCIVE